MAATFPGTIKTFSTKASGQAIASSHINDLQDEVVAIETQLGTNAGAWQDYTPTLTVSGGTAPTYTAAFVNRYCVVGKLCTVNIRWENTTGGVAGAGTGTLTFTLPVTAANADVIVGSGLVYEDGGTDTGAIVYLFSTTQANLIRSTAWVDITGNDQSSTNRYLSATFTYEAA